MNHILLCTDSSIFAQSSYRYAAWLAPRLGAYIDVLYVTDIRSQKAVTTGNLSGTIGIDASKELLNKPGSSGFCGVGGIRLSEPFSGRTSSPSKAFSH